MSGNDAEEPRGATPAGQGAAGARRRRQGFDVDRAIEETFALDTKVYGRFATSRVAAYLNALPRMAPRMAVCAAIGIAVGWLANVITMAGKYDGFVVPPGTTATGQGNVVRGASFWFVASLLVSATASHRINAGSERFWNDVRTFPDTIRSLLRNDDAAMVHALWGFAGATLITYTLGPSLSGAVAVGLVVAVGTFFRPILTGALLLSWRWVVKKVAPQSPNRTGVQAVTVSTLGGAGAMALAVLVTGSGLRLLLGIGAAVGAVALANRKVPGVGTAAVLFAAVAAGAYLVFGVAVAGADDGGWRECGQSLTNWWNCSGSDRARWLAIYGAGASGIGAGLGAGLPGYNGPPDKPWTEMTEEERDAFVDEYVRRFIATHPNATPAQIARFREGLESRPADWWDKTKAFVKDFGDAYWDDLSSGKQAEGLGGFFFDGWNGFKGAAQSTWDELKQLPATLEHLPGEVYKDWASGEMGDRFLTAADAVKHAGEFYADPENRRALVDKYGPEAVDAAFRKMHELDQAMQNMDPTEMRQKIGELTGMAEFEILLGGMGDKGSSEALKMIKEMKASGKMGDFLKATRGGKGGPDVDGTGGLPGALDGKGPKGGPDVEGSGFETHVKPKQPDPDAPPYREEVAPPGGKDNWMDVDPRSRPPMTPQQMEKVFSELKPGDRIALTSEEAAAWGAYEKDMLLQMQKNSKTLGTGDDKVWTELKRGNTDAKSLRDRGYVDESGVRHAYSAKSNNITDKSLERAESFFVPRELEHLQPGEVVSFRPTRIPDVGEVLPDGSVVDQALVDRLRGRVDLANAREAGTKPTVGRGPVIGPDGQQVMGQSWLGDDGRWYQRQQVPDSAGRLPSAPDYQETWGPETRVAGDSDTFAIGGGGEVFEYDDPGAILGYRADGTPIRGWDMTEAERKAYAAAGNTIPGEGNTPLRYKPGVEGYSDYKYKSTIDNVAREGVLLIDQSGMYLSRPGTYYNY
jgi:hypothetical protein